MGAYFEAAAEITSATAKMIVPVAVDTTADVYLPFHMDVAFSTITDTETDFGEQVKCKKLWHLKKCY